VVRPEGTVEGSRIVSAVPSGLDDLGTDQPNVETTLKRWAIVACPSGTGGLWILKSIFPICNPSSIGDPARINLVAYGGIAIMAATIF